VTPPRGPPPGSASIPSDRGDSGGVGGFRFAVVGDLPAGDFDDKDVLVAPIPYDRPGRCERTHTGDLTGGLTGPGGDPYGPRRPSEATLVFTAVSGLVVGLLAVAVRWVFTGRLEVPDAAGGVLAFSLLGALIVARVWAERAHFGDPDDDWPLLTVRYPFAGFDPRWLTRFLIATVRVFDPRTVRRAVRVFHHRRLTVTVWIIATVATGTVTTIGVA
jgi:hypothetical protein